MPYLVDRGRALRLCDVVTIVRGTERRFRSRVTLRDNSLYRTLTRPQTLRWYAETYPKTLARAGVEDLLEASLAEGDRSPKERKARWLSGLPREGEVDRGSEKKTEGRSGETRWRERL